MADKLVLNLPGSVRVWINPQNVVRMERSPDGRYFLRLINGEVYEVDRGTANDFENYLEDL